MANQERKSRIASISSKQERIPNSGVDEKTFAEEKLVERMGVYESKKKEETAFIKDVAGTGGGALLGASIGGPFGALIGAAVGFFLSYSVNHERPEK